ncbi:hypothetical protein D8I35_09550 [Corticibacter populi]|uniref:Uncharacterized protein n=1 Tax=Corticibacter populi TaxID=1550736 RepID=A0A3M6QUN6_9BURK|nr:hypothetical protein [Corticibacter populi]RMX06736.1 hypothetical protein D8I35_09550 [Corticibacter populi]RZS31682.1 hypothetical protein EV687_2351 [Corticibacter populi]
MAMTRPASPWDVLTARPKTGPDDAPAEAPAAAPVAPAKKASTKAAPPAPAPRAATADIRSRTLALLAIDGPLTPLAVAEQLGITTKQAGNNLYQLMLSGKVTRRKLSTGATAWELPASPDELPVKAPAKAAAPPPAAPTPARKSAVTRIVRQQATPPADDVLAAACAAFAGLTDITVAPPQARALLQLIEACQAAAQEARP